MCGIWVYCYKEGKSSLTHGQIYDAFMKIQPRGPDRSVLKYLPKYNLYIGFHRLPIMDTSTKGDQPFIYETDNKLYHLICNGEIYNHKELEEKYDITTSSGSDCEVLLHVWLKIGTDALVKQLNAEYAFIICELDKKTSEVKLHISRDHIGVRPLYRSGNKDEIVFTSELKGSPFLFNYDGNYKVEQFKPRHYATLSSADDHYYDDMKYTEYINFGDIKTTIYDIEEAKKAINMNLKKAVLDRLMSTRPIGFLLSGGIDSSICCGIAAEYYKKIGQKIYTFSIGLKDGTDEIYAKKVAEYIDSVHTHFEVTKEDFLSLREDVVRVTESYDITTVRASTGQLLLLMKIAEHCKLNPDFPDIKVIIGGDNADETFSGYFENYYAPNFHEIYLNRLKRVNDVHYFDGKRFCRCVSNCGIEGRLPFSSLDLLKTCFSINPEFFDPKFGSIEKWLLRESFKNDKLIPEEVLYRNKIAFSDGVSSEDDSWYKMSLDDAEKKISDEEYHEKINKYDYLKPVSKESLKYRELFEKYYGLNIETAKLLPYYWLPNWVNTNEPSARTLDIYKKCVKM